MSDQQEKAESESVSSSESCEQAQPTPGPWQIATSCSYRRIVNDRMSPVCVPTVQSADGHPDLYFPNGGVNGPDARLIAAAGTAAQEAREMGYDPEKVVRALPKILNEIESLLQGEFEHEGVIFPKITDLLRELGGRPLEKDALASAEGSGE